MSPTLPSFCFVLLRSLFLCSCYGKVHEDDEGFEVVDLSTLKPSNVCSAWKAPCRNSLRVVHRLGPCSPTSDSPTDGTQILAQDLLRVAYIQSLSKLANAKVNISNDPLHTSLDFTLPTRHAESFGIGSYVVTIGIGTPKMDQTVVLDTGSSVCWIQCEPCPSCFEQAGPMFEPATSPSYRNIACNDPACTNLPASRRGCINNTCIYRAGYQDSSSSLGFLAKDRLQLSASQTRPMVFTDFVFGCGHSNKGYFGKAAGLFGLGRGFHSLNTQASGSLGNGFSYCLSSVNDIPGYLTIGRRAAPSPVYTRMMARTNSSLYYVDLVGISVAGRRLQMAPMVFQNVGTIIDSGTILTRLPPAAYIELKRTFRSGMSRYRQAPPYGPLDTCYTVGMLNLTHPQITLHFTGLDLPLGLLQTLFTPDAVTYCLAFAASASGQKGIIGNIQQRGMEVIYDIQGQRIGFSRGTNCH